MLKKKRAYFVHNSLLFQQNLRIKLQFLDSKYVWDRNIQYKLVFKYQPQKNTNVANGDRPKYFLEKMLQKYRS